MMQFLDLTLSSLDFFARRAGKKDPVSGKEVFLVKLLVTLEIFGGFFCWNFYVYNLQLFEVPSYMMRPQVAPRVLVVEF